MSEKEKVLQQISDTKSHLIDKKSFVLYNYSACYIWSGIALVLSLLMPYAYTQSVLIGIDHFASTNHIVNQETGKL